MGKDVEVGIPQPFKIDPFRLAGGLELGLDIEPLTVDLGLNNIQADIGLGNASVDLGLDNIRADIGLANASVDIGLDNIKADVDLGLDNIKADLGLDNIQADLGLDNIKVDLGLDNVNVCLGLAIKEFPEMQVQVPTRYELGFRFLGLNIFNFCFSGQTEFVTRDLPTSVKAHHPGVAVGPRKAPPRVGQKQGISMRFQSDNVVSPQSLQDGKD